MSFVTCSKLESSLATKQDALTDCEGAPLSGPVPTCAQLDAAIAAAETPDATTAIRGKVELATVAEALAGLDSERAVTPEGLKAAVDQATTVPDATTTVKGKVELATPAETAAGIDDARATTPTGVKAAIDAIVDVFLQ